MQKIKTPLRRLLSSAALNNAVAAVEKEPVTKLVKMMQSAIKTSGPMSVAHYMQQCLTFPNDGYYMKKDVFGKGGDFVTSPEISQLFGETIGSWLLSLQLHKAGDLQLIELGPGRGTLMVDILRTWRQFPSSFEALKRVDMVETSPYLRQKQLESIRNFSKISNVKFINEKVPIEAELESGLRVNWHDSIENTSSNFIPLFVAHEFFDALPIFQFQKKETGWHEVLVDIDDSPESTLNFRPVLSPKPTPPSQFLPPYLTSTQTALTSAPLSSIFESSPSSFHILSHILKQLKHRDAGVSLIIDYQSSTRWKNSLRGIRHHEFVSPFSRPGEVDVSADVQFSIFDDFVHHQNKNKGVMTLGPTRQDEFLEICGTEIRLKSLLSSSKLSQEDRKELVSGYERLCEMGSSYHIYTILSKWIVDEIDGIHTPFGDPRKNK